MLDIVYVVGTMLFFTVMLLYVRGCAALGRRDDTDTGRES